MQPTKHDYAQTKRWRRCMNKQSKQCLTLLIFGSVIVDLLCAHMKSLLILEGEIEKKKNMCNLCLKLNIFFFRC